MNPAQRAEIVDHIVGQIDAVLEESVRLQREWEETERAHKRRKQEWEEKERERWRRKQEWEEKEHRSRLVEIHKESVVSSWAILSFLLLHAHRLTPLERVEQGAGAARRAGSRGNGD